MILEILYNSYIIVVNLGQIAELNLRQNTKGELNYAENSRTRFDSFGQSA